MTSQIKNELGKVIGFKDETATEIRYRHLTGGLIGIYSLQTGRYVRYKPELGVAMPLAKQDYGFSDVLAYDKLKGR